MKVTNCQVNHIKNPLGYLLDDPVFTWTIEDAEDVKGKFIKEVRITVSDLNGIVKDTGWREDLDSRGGCPLDLKLSPRTRYFWKAAVKTEAGEEAVSDTAFFETGKMEEPWTGKWITCDNSKSRHPFFHKDFSLEEIRTHGGMKAARLYISGLGIYEAYIDGKKVGNEYLTPYSTNYNAWVQYQTYDITQDLKDKNKFTLGALLGNGWYKGRFGFSSRGGDEGYYGNEWKLIAEIHVICQDGTDLSFGTDDSFLVKRTQFVFSNIYDGEYVDQTLPDLLEETALLTDAPKGKLTDRLSTPVIIHEVLPVQEIITTPKGETVLDFGQNMAGIFSLRIREEKGTKIHIQASEILQGGCFYNENLRTAKAEYTLITNGNEQTVRPHFTWYGFRYLKIEGISHFEKDDILAEVLYSELPKTGTLKTGNEKVNQLIHNAEWGQKGNFIDVPTDCPQRDERMGWTGDAQVFCGTATLQRDTYAFFKKYLYDMETEQNVRNGEVPCVVPSFGMENSSTAWGDATCFIPWTLYEYTGDPKILHDHFKAMCDWVEFLNRTEGDNHGWRSHFHYGDWLALDGPDGIDGVQGATDKGLIASAYHRKSALICAKAARVLQESFYKGTCDPSIAMSFTEAAEKYEVLADRLLKEIRDEYYTPTGRCAVPTQTGILLSLSEGLTTNPEKAANDLILKIEDNHGHLSTGFVGTPLLAPVLTSTGHSDKAFDLLLNENYPGWLYEVNLGATTVWERWNSVLEDGSISSTGMNSLNHYAYGSIVEWIYRDVAGLKPAEPGFRKAILAPHLRWELKECQAAYQSASGLWETGWKILSENSYKFRAVVPFGCTATVCLPYDEKEFTLTSGIFEKTVITKQPLRSILTCDSLLKNLLANKAVRNMFERKYPQFLEIPNFMENSSLSEIIVNYSNDTPEETENLIREINTDLKSINLQEV